MTTSKRSSSVAVRADVAAMTTTRIAPKPTTEATPTNGTWMIEFQLTRAAPKRPTAARMVITRWSPRLAASLSRTGNGARDGRSSSDP